MTLRELLEANQTIGGINATIRDISENSAQFLEEIHIGLGAREDFAMKDRPRWKCIHKSINIGDDESGKCGIKWSAIPKDLLNRKVWHWSMWHYEERHCNHLYVLNVDLYGTDKCVVTIDAKESSLEMAEKKCIEGQISLFD